MGVLSGDQEAIATSFKNRPISRNIAPGASERRFLKPHHRQKSVENILARLSMSTMMSHLNAGMSIFPTQLCSKNCPTTLSGSVTVPHSAQFFAKNDNILQAIMLFLLAFMLNSLNAFLALFRTFGFVFKFCTSFGSSSQGAGKPARGPPAVYNTVTTFKNIIKTSKRALKDSYSISDTVEPLSSKLPLMNPFRNLNKDSKSILSLLVKEYKALKRLEGSIKDGAYGNASLYFEKFSVYESQKMSKVLSDLKVFCLLDSRLQPLLSRLQLDERKILRAFRAFESDKTYKPQDYTQLQAGISALSLKDVLKKIGKYIAFSSILMMPYLSQGGEVIFTPSTKRSEIDFKGFGKEIEETYPVDSVEGNKLFKEKFNNSIMKIKNSPSGSNSKKSYDIGKFLFNNLRSNPKLEEIIKNESLKHLNKSRDVQSTFISSLIQKDNYYDALENDNLKNKDINKYNSLQLKHILEYNKSIIKLSKKKHKRVVYTQYEEEFKIDWEKEIARSFFLIGDLSERTYNYPLAKQSFKKAKKYFEKVDLKKELEIVKSELSCHKRILNSRLKNPFIFYDFESNKMWIEETEKRILSTNRQNSVSGSNASRGIEYFLRSDIKFKKYLGNKEVGKIFQALHEKESLSNFSEENKLKSAEFIYKKLGSEKRDYMKQKLLENMNVLYSSLINSENKDIQLKTKSRLDELKDLNYDVQLIDLEKGFQFTKDRIIYRIEDEINTPSDLKKHSLIYLTFDKDTLVKKNGESYFVDSYKDRGGLFCGLGELYLLDSEHKEKKGQNMETNFLSEYLSLHPSNTRLNPQNFTITYWAKSKRKKHGAWGGVGVSITQDKFYYSVEEGHVRIVMGHDSEKPDEKRREPSPNIISISGVDNIPWRMFSLVWSKNKVDMYVDSKYEGSVGNTFGHSLTFENVRVGGGCRGPPQSTGYLVDDFSIINKALSPYEIGSIYNSSIRSKGKERSKLIQTKEWLKLRREARGD